MAAMLRPFLRFVTTTPIARPPQRAAGRPLFAAACLLAAGAACSPSRAVEPPRWHTRPSQWTPSTWSTADYEATPAFSPDGRRAVFMRADPGFGRYRLLESECIAGRWTPPRELPIASSAAMHDADPFVTPDGRELWFVSTRHRYDEVGNDDFDIFVSTRGADGHWEEPQRLPEPVNSPASELLPSLDGSGALYFGSSRPGGRGGSDIYRATRGTDGAWTVTAVDAVNTAANEFEAEVSLDGSGLVVVSDREIRSRLYVYRRAGETWIEEGRIQAHDDVFQVGPRFSPDGHRLLFAQADGEASGELFLIDLDPGADARWPPACGHADRATDPVPAGPSRPRPETPVPR